MATFLFEIAFNSYILIQRPYRSVFSILVVTGQLAEILPL